MTQPQTEARGQCPACAMPIPFARTISGRGEGFACKACGRTLVIPKLGLLPILLIGGAGLGIAKIFGVPGFIIALATIGLGDWKLARTRLVDPGDA